MKMNERVVPVRKERRHAEPANKGHVAKCFELISKIARLSEELSGMERTEAESYELAAMLRADEKLMGRLEHIELDYIFPFPFGWRRRELSVAGRRQCLTRTRNSATRG